jgi:diketogulonate reductase-like aldo/keto reductase
VQIAERHEKSPAQVLIRWSLQNDLVVIPKSSKSDRIKENASVFDFELSDMDMKLMAGFHENLRTCWDPTDEP